MNESSPAQSFPTTLWTVVLRAGRADSATALAQLCQSYWYPLYSFVRRRGHSPEDGQDLTQAFFAHLLEKHGLERVDPQQGRFRTFLLASLKNFLANEWDKANALKRGGGQQTIALDGHSAESRYQLEPSHDLTPERHFERQWALTLLDQVLADLRDEYRVAGNETLFDELKAVLVGQGEAYADIARRLDRSEGAIKVAVHRLRGRYRERMLERIAATVGEADVEDELRHLLTALQ